MATILRAAAGLLAALLGSLPLQAVELKVSRDALERTLKSQLFGGPGGLYYVRGNAQTPCYVYTSDPQLSFAQDRLVVRVKTFARVGKTFGGKCFGFSLNTESQVSVAPNAEGEEIGFRDARIDRVFEQKELNFILGPFLSHQVPSAMKVNAADLLRKALSDSTAKSGYKVTLDRLKVHSMMIQGDNLVVDIDGDISIK